MRISMQRMMMLAVFALMLMAGRAFAQAPMIDVARITDGKTRAAFENVLELQSRIKELKIDEMTSVVFMKMANVPTTVTTKTVIMERRPDLFFKKDKVIGGVIDGTQMGMLMDGKKMWQITVSGPGQLKMIEQRMRQRNTPQAEIDKVRAQFMRAQVTQCDLQRLKEAGVLDKIQASAKVSNPIASVDPAGLKLDGETPAEWVFSSKQAGAQPALMMTYSKADGVCVRMESKDEHMSFRTSVDKYAVNPAPPIKDAVFSYQPSPNVKVTDTTDQTIQMLKGIRMPGR